MCKYIGIYRYIAGYMWIWMWMYIWISRHRSIDMVTDRD